MTIVAAVMLPIVLLYQGYTYVVFRHRLAPPATRDTPSTPPTTPPPALPAEAGRPAQTQGPCQPPVPATSASAAGGPHEPGAYGVHRRRGVEQRLHDPPVLLDDVLAC